MENTEKDPFAKYADNFDEEENFQMTLGNEKNAASVSVYVTPDPTQEEEPQTEIEVHHGLDDRQAKEFDALVASLIDESWYTYYFNMDNFVKEMKDWLFFRTSDDAFRTADKPKPKPTVASKTAGPSHTHQSKLAKIKEAKMQRNQAKAVQQAMSLVARGYVPAGVPHVNRIYRDIQDQRQNANRQAEIDLRIDGAQNVLYRGMRRQSEFAGEQFGWYLENIELAFAEDWGYFSQPHSHIPGIPKVIGKLHFLTEINLSLNAIPEIPLELFDLGLLRKLNLSWNRISEIPHQISKLKALTLFEIDHNLIERVPESLSECTNLEHIEFSNNRIRFFPESIVVKCPKLRTLGLESNFLSHVPPAIGYLKSLELLLLKNNPMKMIAAQVYHQGLKAVMQLLRDYLPDASMLPGSDFQREFSPLLFSETFADCYLSVGKEKFPLHLALIEARAPGLFKVIDKAIRSSAPQSSKPSVSLYADRQPAQRFETLMKLVLTYIYTDSPGWIEKKPGDESALILTKEDREDLEIAEAEAVRFEIPRLAAKCRARRFISTDIPESCYAADLKKLFGSEKSSDIAFSIEGIRLPAHRCIVAQRSQYLHAMFSSGLKEARQDVIEIADLNYETFKQLLEFIYIDDCEPTSETAIDLLTASAMYELPRLTAILESVVGFSLDWENAACILEIAVLYKCKKLELACLYFIASNYRKVRSSDAWKEMGPEYKDMVVKTAEEWKIDL